MDEVLAKINKIQQDWWDGEIPSFIAMEEIRACFPSKMQKTWDGDKECWICDDRIMHTYEACWKNFVYGEE